MMPAETMVPSVELREELEEVEAQINGLMARVRENIKTAAASIHPELSPFGFRMLWQLRKCGPLGASAIAAHLGVDRSFMSRQIRQLEGWGLIDVAPDTTDGRAKVVALSPAADAALAAMAESGRIVLRGSLAAWSTADLRQFARYLERLNSATNDD